MPRTVKTVQDKDGKDLEVYSDNCLSCSKEMIFPKAEADRIDAMFPFIKEKAEAGSNCVDCTVKLEKENGFRMFNESEVEMIKQMVMKNG